MPDEMDFIRKSDDMIVGYHGCFNVSSTSGVAQSTARATEAY